MIEEYKIKDRVKVFVTVKIEGMRKRGRPRIRWTDEIEEDLNIQ